MGYSPCHETSLVSYNLDGYSGMLNVFPYLRVQKISIMDDPNGQEQRKDSTRQPQSYGLKGGQLYTLLYLHHALVQRQQTVGACLAH